MGSGHAMDMNSRIRQNRQLLMNKRQRRARMRHLFYTSVSNSNTELKRTELTAVELEILKSKLREQLARERRREVIFTVIIFIIAVIFATLFMVFIF